MQVSRVPNTSPQYLHMVLYFCQVSVTVHGTKIGSPLGLLATHAGWVYVLVYVPAVISTFSCAHVSLRVSADAVIPALPARIITAANNAITFFISVSSCFPCRNSAAAAAYPVLGFCVYSYSLPAQWNHPLLCITQATPAPQGKASPGFLSRR